MDALPQEVFSLVETLLQSAAANLNNGTIVNGTTEEGSSTMFGAAGNSSPIGSLIALFLSFSALRDWLKLFFLGGMLESGRRWLLWAYNRLIDSFFVTVWFEEDDDAYEWMLYWVSKQTNYTKVRQLEVTTRSFGLGNHGVLVPGETAESSDDFLNGGRKLAYLPSSNHTYQIFYKKHWMTIERQAETLGYRKLEKLCLCIFAWNQNILNELLLEAKKTYMASREDCISIYASDSTNSSWNHVATRPKRAMSSVVLEEGIQDLILEDARDFLSSKEWYSDRGIPFRRGYLLWGKPGCGKTSIIHCMAGELGLDVYIVSLSRKGMDDAGLTSLIQDLPEKCIALMEDVDAAFASRDTVNVSPAAGDENEEEEKQRGEQKKEQQPTSGVSLSGLLNALDGIGAAEGRILFATTNHYETLDPALCRPGRMDVHIEFKLASQLQARELFQRFYLPTKKKTTASSESSASTPEAPVIDEKSAAPEVSDAASDSSGTIVAISSPDSLATQSIRGQSHRRRAPKLSEDQIAVLADRFSRGLPDREFSMAAVQGYLMVYKTRPYEAADYIGAWVEKERAEIKRKVELAVKGKKKQKTEASKKEEIDATNSA